MNAENFSEYIKNPSQLYQVSYQELKSLVLQYPYSPNLRYLLLRKAKMDGHADYEKLLATASTFSIDRAFLFYKMKEAQGPVQMEDNYELNEEYLELKDLNSLEASPELVEGMIKEEADELTFALDDLMDSGSTKEEIVPATPIGNDNLAEEDQDSLLERILDGEFTEVEASEHEVSGNLSLSEMKRAAHDKEDRPKEEAVIGQMIEELTGKVNQEAEKDFLEEDKEDFETVIVVEQKDGTPVLTALDKEAELDSLDIYIEEEGQIFEQERIPDKEEEPAKAVQEEILEDEDQSLDLDDLGNETTKEEVIPQMPAPQPKSSFNSWLQQYRSPLLDSRLQGQKEVTDKKKEKKKVKTKEKETLGIAKASVREDNEIASETLALLLEKQGHFERAIRMYETLSLRNPEKNSFFAAKISALQKALNKE